MSPNYLNAVLKTNCCHIMNHDRRALTRPHYFTSTIHTSTKRRSDINGVVGLSIHELSGLRMCTHSMIVLTSGEFIVIVIDDDSRPRFSEACPETTLAMLGICLHDHLMSLATSFARGYVRLDSIASSHFLASLAGNTDYLSTQKTQTNCRPSLSNK